ncbi:DNA-deoxyinosine glycosylase [Flavobacterium sp. CYK-55]|uniref:DNA-deoxyinosine glycosylase n=1 Tax=Flavobacterium sp. CYK-55 TaxID=2835529 RepID=UPI001BCF4D15|nr:DNA-deoxyinosine glycosylase [Flavobacterium sp. CYK-55]MBS7786636.1 DNA-deoxyinosine glycosylase [Flavobacterium sp. CYK-55]
MKIKSFPPIVNPQTRVLILGTMPGAASLAQSEYYAHPQNQFWKIMFTIFAYRTTPETFVEKVKLIQQNHIGLWDVLQYCEREGSLDSNIKNPEENDLPGLLKQYPNIQKIIFNGQESHRLFHKKFGHLIHLEKHIMPSTSPAHTLEFEHKLAAWQKALNH